MEYEAVLMGMRCRASKLYKQAERIVRELMFHLSLYEQRLTMEPEDLKANEKCTADMKTLSRIQQLIATQLHSV